MNGSTKEDQMRDNEGMSDSKEESQRSLEILVEYFAQWLNIPFADAYDRFTTPSFAPDPKMEAIAIIFDALANRPK